MKNQALIDVKRSSERRVSNATRKIQNAAYRQMRTCGLPCNEFEEIFPGNTFLDFRNAGRNRAKMRKKINAG